MVKGVINGLRTLFWAIVLLVFVTYAVGVLLRQTVGEDKVAIKDDPYGTVLFSSVPWSMFIVFRCLTADCTLTDGSPLDGHMHALYGPIFMIPYAFVVIFVFFGLFNLIAATFVENVLEAARQKRQMNSDGEAIRVLTKLRQLVLKFGGTKSLGPSPSRYANRVGSSGMSVLEDVEGPDVMFDVQEVHFQCGGQVTREMFAQVMQDSEVHVLFDDLEVHMADRADLFDTIDADANGAIDVSELILGILKLRSGGADKSDMVAAILGIRSIQKTAIGMMEMICDLKAEVGQLQKHSGSGATGSRQIGRSSTAMSSMSTKPLASQGVSIPERPP